MPVKYRKSLFIYFFKLAVAFALLYILVAKIQEKESIVQVLTGANWWLISLAALLLIPNILISVWKWHYLLRCHYHDLALRESWGSYLLGSTLGLITPGSLGELARGIFFSHRDRSLITGLNVIDKLFNLIIFITFGFFSVNRFLFLHMDWPKWVFIPLAIICFLFIILIWLLALNPQWIKFMLKPFLANMQSGSKFQRFFSAIQPLDSRHTRSLMLFSLIFFLIIVLQYDLVVRSFTHISFFESLQAVASTIFVKIFLPVSFGDLGIRESAAIFFFSKFGISGAVAFNTSLFIFLVNVAFPAIIGYYFIAKLKAAVASKPKTMDKTGVMLPKTAVENQEE